MSSDNGNYEQLRESSASSIQDLIKKNVEINKQFNEWFRPKGSYTTEYKERYQPPPSQSPTFGRKKRLDITPIGEFNRGQPVKSKDAGAPPPPKISKQNLAKVSTNVKFAWPGTSEENKQHLEQEKSVKKSLKSKPDTPSKSQKEKNVKERSMKKESDISQLETDLKSNYSAYVGADLDRNKTKSEYQEKFHEWEIEKTIPNRPNDTNPIGSNPDAVPPSNWKSFARQSMEEVAEAMKEISYSQPHAIEPHVSQAPSNYAWPVYEAEHQQIHNLRQENTEYRENFRAWESEKNLRVRPPPSNPICSEVDAASSNWKSHAQVVMEETERAKQNFAASKIAGVETSSNKIPAPPNYAWPTPSNIEVSNRNLSFDDVHTEYRDNYLKWAVEKATKSNRPASNPIVLETNGFTPEDWVTEAQRARLEAEKASQNHRPEDFLIAGVRTSKNDRSPPNFAWTVPEKPKRVTDFKNAHTEYRDNYPEWEIHQNTKLYRPASSNPIALDAENSDSRCWISEAQESMQTLEEAVKSKQDNSFTAGVPSLQSETAPSNFAWPITEVPQRVADFSNVHTEYRDNFHEWDFEKSKLQRPTSTNPITSNSSSSENWVSETRQSMADAQVHGHQDSITAGVQISRSEQAPPNFSWPVPEIPKHIPDFKNNVHTEYRDNFSSWEVSKAKLSRPPSSNPISMSLDSTPWISEAKSTMADVTQNRPPNEYLIAGVTSSQHDRTPPNFAWPVPDVHPRQIDYTKNVHTEYRDNFHEWGAENQARHVDRPKDGNPIVLDKDSNEWKSEYQRTIGNTTPNQYIVTRERSRNEFSSNADNFTWNTEMNQSLEKRENHESNKNFATIDSVLSLDSLEASKTIPKFMNQPIRSSTLGGEATQFVGTTEYRDQFRTKIAEQPSTQPKPAQSFSFTADDNHSRVEKKATESRSSSHQSSTSSLPYSGARKTHISVLPSQMKFYGTTEYKDQYTNKGVNAEFYKSPRTSSGFSLYTEDSHPVEKKLTPKKLKEQEMTEHRSSYIWPSNSLYHQNHVRPTKRHNMAECLAAGDLITPSISASQKSHNGIEEMKTTEVLSKPMEGTKKSFVETDSIGSQILTPSSSGRLNDSTPREKVDRWGPSHNIEVTSPIQKLGLRQSFDGSFSNRGIRSQSVPNRRYPKGHDLSNPILANTRYPSTAQSSRWRTETRDSYVWKKK